MIQDGDRDATDSLKIEQARRMSAWTGIGMAKKPNYGQERAQRSRAQQSRRDEKLQKLEEETRKRKAARDGQPNADPEPDKS